MIPNFTLFLLLLTITFCSATYTFEGLTNWCTAVLCGLLALLVSVMLFKFFAFFAKANADFPRVVCVSVQARAVLAWCEVLRGSAIHGEVISDCAQQIGAVAIIRHEDANFTALVVSRGYLGLRQRVIKRGFDMVVALLALVLLSPVLLSCAAEIAIDDGAPVFLRQRRMGRRNRFFDIGKFPTLHNELADAHGLRWAAIRRA